MHGFALFIVLLAAATCQASVGKDKQRQEVLKYLEYLKPCIMKGEGCPADGSLSYSAIESIVRQMVALRLPEECKCDLKNDDCGRRCYYAFLVKSTLATVANGKTDPAEIKKAQDQAVETLESSHKPCILEKKNCHIIGEFDFSTVESLMRLYKKNYALPIECDVDLSSESSVRNCYFHFVKKHTLNTLEDKKKRA